MSAKDNNEEFIASIVAAFAARPDVSPDDIVDLTRKLRRELGAEAAEPPRAAAPRPGAEAGRPAPALPPEDAVTQERVFCLCCGKGFKMLKRHLGSEHGLTEAQYRRMFDLSDDTPLVAPSYSEKKADYAKKAGLGKHARRVASRARSSDEHL